MEVLDEFQPFGARLNKGNCPDFGLLSDEEQKGCCMFYLPVLFVRSVIGAQGLHKEYLGSCSCMRKG